MKKLAIVASLALSLGMSLWSCSKENVSDIMPGTAWYVVERSENGVDLTTQFDEYKFNFNGGDTLTAIVPGQLTQLGTWTVDANNTTLNIAIGSSFNLDKISANWTIKTYSPTDLELYDDGNMNDKLLLRKH